jgi:hypothetical protein
VALRGMYRSLRKAVIDKSILQQQNRSLRAYKDCRSARHGMNLK